MGKVLGMNIGGGISIIGLVFLATFFGLAGEKLHSSEKFEDFDLVFSGRLGGSYPSTPNNFPGIKLGETLTWKTHDHLNFYNPKIWKGDLRPTGAFNSIRIENLKENSFEFKCCDGTYLIYATKTKDGKYIVHKNSPTKLVKTETEVLKKIGKPIYIEKKPYYRPLSAYKYFWKDKFGDLSHELVSDYRALEKKNNPCVKKPKIDAIFLGMSDLLYFTKMAKGKKLFKDLTHHYRGEVIPWKHLSQVGFRVSKIWKGTADHLGGNPNSKTLFGFVHILDESSYDFVVTDRMKAPRATYLVYATLKQGKLVVDRCSQTKLLREVTKQELKRLGKPTWVAPQKK